MQLICYPATLSSIRVFGTALNCAECGDQLIAPMASEFVESGEIRHYWQCDACGAKASTSIAVEPQDEPA